MNGKQEAFCREYVANNCHPKDAAIRAGYSARTAGSMASRLLSKVEIQDYIFELKQEAARRNEITVDRVLEEYRKIAFSDMRDFMEWGQVEQVIDSVIITDEDGNEREVIKVIERSFVRLKPADQVDGTMIESISETKDGVRLKLHDKMKALDFLRDYLEMAPRGVKASGKIDVAAQGNLIVEFNVPRPGNQEEPWAQIEDEAEGSE